jgi:hypothetical protein
MAVGAMPEFCLLPSFLAIACRDTVPATLVLCVAIRGSIHSSSILSSASVNFADFAIVTGFTIKSFMNSSFVISPLP